MTRPIGLSIKQKLIFFGLLVSFISIIIISGTAYYGIKSVLIDTAIQSMRNEARLMTLRLWKEYHEMESDVLLLSDTPPIQGIIRSSLNSGVDPIDGSSSHLWKSRLASIFQAMLKGRPQYTQIRYIGLSQNGKEIVRVNQNNGIISITPPQDLQEKINEPYFKQIETTPNSNPIFSEVYLNREHGKIDPAHIPTVRVMLPIDAQLPATIHTNPVNKFGFIVINTNYETLLHRAFSHSNSNKKVTIINDKHDYLVVNKDGSMSELELHNDYTKTPPSFIQNIWSQTSEEGVIYMDNQVVYFTKLSSIQDGLLNKPKIAIVISQSMTDLLSSTRKARKIIIWLAIIIFVIKYLLTQYMAQKLSNPINKITLAIKKTGNDKLNIDLPTERRDEIGELARAFNDNALTIIENEHKLRTILDAVDDGIITLDQDHKIITYNPACKTIFGYTESDCLGQPIGLIIPTLETDCIGITKHGDSKNLSVSISSAKNHDAPITILCIRDITELKKMEMMKDQFISTVNHELRTPLTAIQGGLGLLKMKAKDVLDEKSLQYLDIAHKNCIQLSYIINDILDSEKISAGKMQYTFEPTDLVELLSDIVTQTHPYAEKYDVTYEFKTRLKSAIVNADDKRLTQAIMNLLSNAAKFSKKNGFVTVTLKSKTIANPITQNSTQNSDKKSDKNSNTTKTVYAIEVKDQGIGIPKSAQNKIFNRFFQADGSSIRQVGGTGLGLNITRHIIEAHNGTISFKTKENEGTTFTILLNKIEN